MRENRIYIDYINDIVEAIVKIRIFIGDIDFDEFKADEKTQFAVVRALEIIGEASKKIPDFIKDSSSDIPWREMTGMRDKLIHDYFGVDIEVVWKTATKDVLSLENSLRKLISQYK